jgi:type II secretory pathway pseudopilin PulG
MLPPSHPRPVAAMARRPSPGYTLLEVMLAAFVLALGIMSALIVLQSGLRSLDTARNLTNATAAMQSEIERLRLMNWSQLQQLEDSHETNVPVARQPGAAALVCTRQIQDYKPDMKQIVLSATWRGIDGRPHTARMVTRYCRDGLNDYYYAVR